MTTGSLSSLTAALEQTTDFSAANLMRIMEENLPPWSEIEPLVAYGDPYGRVTLVETSQFEIMIGSWKKGDWCEAHDHGPSVGAVHAYSGNIEHFSFRFADADGDLHLMERCSISKDDALTLDLGMIHSLTNTSSDTPFVGLHVYSPPTHDVRVFDLKTGDIFHITNDHGAYVPEDPTKIVKHEPKRFRYRNALVETEAQA
ncbi:MAG: cysteine dioxygenase family protein [Candidatus Kapaibacterium sp.]|jgi:predicted metal-dependent enzyme (double-stranded beta helix superfamily)